MNDPRGSIWRKWDLHLHAPGTKKNDQYETSGYETSGPDALDLYCDKLERSDVAAFGITDYFSADSYFVFLGRFKARYPNSTKVFFPNIELYTSDVVNAASEEVNLHLIFNPFAQDHESSIKKFLQHLDTNKTGSGGKKIKASELKSEKDFHEATTSRDMIKKAFDATFGPSADLSEHVLVFTAANNDGIRPVRGKKRKALITDELDKFSHGFFGNAGNTAYFLSTDRLEDKCEIDPKPVITGSDCHSFANLEAWLGKVAINNGIVEKEPTWIKADPTYEGLKQIIFEPAGRVFIGEEPEVESRVRENKRRYISSLTIGQAPGYDGRHGIWFDRERIGLGKELIAIIGNKGNGKSALTDVIGLLGNSHNQRYEREGKREELFSFLNREKFLKANCASYFSAQLNWYAGDPNEATLDQTTDTSVPESVEYLPQKYLEKICANIEDDEFRHKLNEVIFEYVKQSDRYGQTSLDELIQYRALQASADIEDAKEILHGANDAVLSLEKKLAPEYLREIQEKLRLKKADLDAHTKDPPTAVPPPPQGGGDATLGAAQIREIDKKLEEVQKRIRDSRAEQPTLTRSLEDLRQARQAIERQVNALTGLKVRLGPLLAGEGLQFEDLVSVKTSFERFDSIMAAKDSRLDELAGLLRTGDEIEALELPIEEDAAAKNTSLVCLESGLRLAKQEITEKLGRPARDYQAYLSALAEWDSRKKELEGDPNDPAQGTLNWIKQELHYINNALPQELKTAKEDRAAASKAVYAKKKSLVTFYEEVKRSIDQEIGRYGTDLREYNISIEAGLKLEQTFYDDFFRFINQQVKGSFHGSDDGRATLKRLAGAVSSWENENEVFQFLEAIDQHLHIQQGSDTPGTESRDVFKQMRQNKEPIDLYDLLFGFDYLKTKYDLKIDGKDLRELSSGERGGLLLIFYLMLDRREIPLVIDQPEDNLDNKSVYEILVTFLKQAKKRRQIIIVTHNPNLAVVADAEQIIHVSIDKRGSRNDFDFESGAIENPAINRAVVDILEGTLPAFNNRRLKYRRQLLK
jgi:predicted ATPase